MTTSGALSSSVAATLARYGLEFAERSPSAIVLCDGSRSGDAAIRFAAREALLRSSPLVVVAARSWAGAPPLAAGQPGGTDPRAAHTAAVLALCRALSCSPAGMSPHSIVTGAGEAARLLHGGAAHVDMIVVGAEDRELVQQLVQAPMAGTADQRDGGVPVVVVPADAVSSPTGRGGPPRSHSLGGPDVRRVST